MSTDAPAPGTAARHARMGTFAVKGSVLRGHVASLRARNALGRIVEHLGPAARALVLEPPAVTAWIEGKLIVELDDVIYDVLGEKALGEISLETSRDSVSPLLRSVSQGTLQLFGASPVTLLSRLGALSRSTVRGIEFEWRSTDERSGTMTVSYPDSADVPVSAFVSMRGGLVNTLRIAGAKDSVSSPVCAPSPPRNSARFSCSW